MAQLSTFGNGSGRFSLPPFRGVPSVTVNGTARTLAVVNDFEVTVTPTPAQGDVVVFDYAQAAGPSNPDTVTASRTLTPGDVAAGRVDCNSGSAIVLTIPQDSVLGTYKTETIVAYQVGAGVVSFVAGSDVTLRAASGLPASTQYGFIGITRVGVNEWAQL